MSRYGEWSLVGLMSQEEACTISRQHLRLAIAYLDLCFEVSFFQVSVCLSQIHLSGARTGILLIVVFK